MDEISSPWSWRLFRSSAAGAAALLLATGAITAAPQGGAQTPQFRAGIDLVEVDVTVLDRDGRPVTTLTAADFEVRERGDLQRIDTISLVSADAAILGRSGSRAAVEAGQTAPDAAVTPVRPLGPRVFVFVFDMAHLSANGLTRGRTALRSFLGDGLRPGDLAGIVVDGTMLGNRIISDKAVLLAQLDGLAPPNLSRFNERRQWPRILSEEEAVAIARNNTTARDAAVMRACEERPGDCEKGGRAAVEAEIDGKSRLIASEALRDGQTALTVLLTLVNGLGRFQGPKHVVFLSEGFYTGEFAERVTQVAGLASQNRVRVSTLDARGLNTDLRQQDLFGAAPVQGTGDLAVLGADADADVLTTLALETGGQRVRNRNNLRPALDAIATETGTYYILGYSPIKPFDGSYRSIDVRVRRPGLTVRARRGYLAERIENPQTAIGPSTSLGAGNRETTIDNRQAGIDNRQTTIDNRANPPAAAATLPAPVTPPGGLPTTPPAGAPPAASPVAAPVTTPAAAGASGDPVGALRLRPDAALGRNVGTVTDRLAAPAGAGPELAARLAREGWDLYSKGDVEGARDRLAAAAEAGGGAWVHYALGLSEFTLRHVDAARAAFEAVRRAEPEFKGVYFDLADAYLQLGRAGDALSVLRDAQRRWPEDAETHNAVGVVLVKRGALDDAVEAFTRATSTAPADGLGYYNLGRVQHMRYLRWQQTTPSTPSTKAMADRARTSALEAYRKSVAIGGSFEKEARAAIAALDWK